MPLAEPETGRGDTIQRVAIDLESRKLDERLSRISEGATLFRTVLAGASGSEIDSSE